MPKITNFRRCRLLVNLDRMPAELYEAMISNKVFYVIEPTAEELEEGITVEDTFDEINWAIHNNTKGKYYLHTKLRAAWEGLKAKDDNERYLVVSAMFELREDMENFISKHLVMEKLKS